MSYDNLVEDSYPKEGVLNSSKVIQVEYFAFDATGSLDDLFAYAAARAEETLPDFLNGLIDTGPGLKICVRFHDKSGEVTELIERVKRSKTIEEGAFQNAREANNWVLFIRYWRWRLAKNKAEKEATKLRFSLINAIVNQTVAIERYDHSYRLVRADEKHELTSNIKRWQHFWIFVYAPNDLLADNNEVVLSLM